MPTSRKILEEFTVKVLREDLGFEIPLCGLCANSGIIDTTLTAIWNGKKVGVRGYCLCLNGRALKRKFNKPP